MQQITNRALISQLYSSADQRLEDANYDNTSWSSWYDVVQGMTVPEKMVYVIVKLNQSVTSGGFAEFYENSLGIFAPEIIHALNEIKANATADIVANTLPIVNPDALLDENYKAFVFNIQLSEPQKAHLHGQDIKYDHLEGHENLEDLLGDYLQGKLK